MLFIGRVVFFEGIVSIDILGPKQLSYTLQSNCHFTMCALVFQSVTLFIVDDTRKWVKNFHSVEKKKTFFFKVLWFQQRKEGILGPDEGTLILPQKLSEKLMKS